ncbi:MAG: DUF2784 domain-containing protein [Deferrisomatales bacterium]|nr:DUF2784 domain-containing protein [Deferrisomatales bacterium]
MACVVADLVVVHLAWILFLVFGAVAGRRWTWVKWVHLAALAFAVVLTAGGWICPLTHLEVWLRRGVPGARGSYPGAFLGHYAERLVYLDVPRWAVLVAAIGIAGGSVWVYAGGSRRVGRDLEERP